MFLNRVPESLQEAVAALRAVVGPFQRLLGRRRKHHEQAHGVRTVLRDQLLRVDGIALVLGHLRAVFEHHSLRQQVGEWLGDIADAFVAHYTLEKACVQQMQDRVLYTADVLIDRRPVGRALVQHRLVIVRARVAREIPGRLHKRIERVGFAARAFATLRTWRVDELGNILERRTVPCKLDIFRQNYRQLIFGYWYRIAIVAVDDRNRRTPIALP